MWLRLASHLGMAVQEVQAKTTTSEFFLWIEYFEWEMNHPTKLDHYLAEIRAEIRRGYVKNPRTVKPMYVKFQSGKAASNAKRSKQFWTNAVMGKKA